MPSFKNKGHYAPLRVLVGFPLLFSLSLVVQVQGQMSDHVLPKRTSQIQDGFGINSDLPRDPYLPWNRWWWTRIFDAGISFVRIGQYENSTDHTSWDWVERKRGEYSIAPEVEDEIDSLVENGVKIEIQLLYGNPLYTSPAGVCRRPSSRRQAVSITPIEASIRYSGRRGRPSRSTLSQTMPNGLSTIFVDAFNITKSGMSPILTIGTRHRARKNTGGYSELLFQ